MQEAKKAVVAGMCNACVYVYIFPAILVLQGGVPLCPGLPNSGPYCQQKVGNCSEPRFQSCTAHCWPTINTIFKYGRSASITPSQRAKLIIKVGTYVICPIISAVELQCKSLNIKLILKVLFTASYCTLQCACMWVVLRILVLCVAFVWLCLPLQEAGSSLFSGRRGKRCWCVVCSEEGGGQGVVCVMCIGDVSLVPRP